MMVLPAPLRRSAARSSRKASVAKNVRNANPWSELRDVYPLRLLSADLSLDSSFIKLESAARFLILKESMKLARRKDLGV